MIVMIDNKIIKVDVYKLGAFSYERKNDRSFRKCTDLVSPIICERVCCLKTIIYYFLNLLFCMNDLNNLKIIKVQN